MKIAQFSIWIAGLVLAVAAHSETWQAGEHYEVLQVPVKTADPDRVEVVEVFSYACIHCFNFEPELEPWLERQSEDVDFRRVPAIFSAEWAYLAQAYFAAQALMVEEQVHKPLFQAIHQKGVNVMDPDILAELFEKEAGVSPEDFHAVFSSFAVKGRVQQAQARTRAYRITGVPTVIVNGKYRLSGDMAGGNAQMLELMDYLIAQELGNPQE
jgi:thiol:disulfide interchange protein DsbA